MEGLTKARTTLYQLSALALRTGNSRFIRLINLLCMFTFRITATSNKHAETPLTERKFAAAERAKLTLQNFNDMSIRLAFQRTNIITFRIVGTTEKRAVFPGPNNKFSPALWAGLIFMHREQC
ncbi:hypothetical protein SS37_24435 [Enterobacter sichuanensis]|uniref:Uncharacterized protein n=1 Tax=Enterobacter sichuanensis TaxID=2071710 RepID=A0A0F0ZY19_9ENTR|nr:hypothetical protein SS37_24435 [Enterobacter sichuanensis]